MKKEGTDATLDWKGGLVMTESEKREGMLVVGLTMMEM